MAKYVCDWCEELMSEKDLVVASGISINDENRYYYHKKCLEERNKEYENYFKEKNEIEIENDELIKLIGFIILVGIVIIFFLFILPNLSI